MSELEDLLYSIFEDLRRKRVPLGMSDYIVALEAIKALTDAEDREAIKDLGRLFWAKSPEDQLLFDEIFAMHVARQQALQKQEVPPNASPSPSSPMPHSPPSSTTPQVNPPVPVKREQPKPPMITPRMHPQTMGTTHPRELQYRGAATYHLTPRAPMDKRDMASVWRKLRRTQREGLSEELDIQATTDALAQTGFLFQPVLQYRRRNQAKLVVMIDQGGSMEPFALFLDAVLESILRSGSLRHIHLFYFHDTPEEYLYLYPTLLGARPLESVLSEYCQNTSVLIMGDAGAARGHYDSTRIQAAKEVIDKLEQYTYLYSWLNPVPKARWAHTTAAYIAQLLPMFPLNWEGLNDTVNVLRGQALAGVQEP
jgi:uncharacterized protein